MADSESAPFTEPITEAVIDGTTTDPGNKRIVVVLFDGALLSSMSFAVGVFDVAAHYGALPGVELSIIAGEPDTTIASGGLACPVPYEPQTIAGADLVIVPNLPQSRAEDPPESILAELRGAHASGAKISGLCTGSFVLAAAGLLDGRSATTNWIVADRMARLHPAVRVDRSALYIDHGDVLTAGGGAAGMDAGLHILRTMIGASATNRVARAMVVPPHRPGGQAQYIETPIIDDPSGEDPVVESMVWAQGRLDRTIPVSVLADRAHLSRRQYDRRFQELNGATPTQWLRHQRVVRAQHLLETSNVAIEEVALSCGFSTAAALRPHFRRLVEVTMADYRQTFSQG